LRFSHTESVWRLVALSIEEHFCHYQIILPDQPSNKSVKQTSNKCHKFVTNIAHKLRIVKMGAQIMR